MTTGEATAITVIEETFDSDVRIIDKHPLAVGPAAGSLPSLRECSPESMFNGYVGAHLAFAFQDLGIFDHLGPESSRSVEALAGAVGCHPQRLRALLDAGEALGLVHADADRRYAFSEAGEDLRRHIGFFTWSVGGYSAFFRGLSDLAAPDPSEFRQLIDGKMVALGSDQVNEALMKSVLHDVLGGLKAVRCVADLGCGNAGRLIDFCRRYPFVSGLGFDINAGAIELAARTIEDEQLADRIAVRKADVLDAVEAKDLSTELAGVDLVTCFMMLHDLFNSVPPVEMLGRIRRAFPNARAFLFADTFRMAPVGKPSELPIFSLGFELVHSMMGIKIHAPQDYLDAFREAGLHLKVMRPFGAPNTFLFLLETAV